MDIPLMEGRLGSLDTQSEAGAGGLGAEAAQGGHFWRVRKALRRLVARRWKQGLRCRLPRPPSQCLCPQRLLHLDLTT